MFNYQELHVLPSDIRRDFGAHLAKAVPTEHGAIRLVGARRTTSGALNQRITVQVLTAEGAPVPGVDVGFFFSTGKTWLPSVDFVWPPPRPWTGDVFATSGSGEIDHVQGSVIKAGQSGGITVCCLHPLLASDVVSGAGMLADHTGLWFTYMVMPNGYVSTADRLKRLETKFEEFQKLFYGQ